MVMTVERNAHRPAVAPNDARPLEPHAYAEGVRVKRGADGRAYRLCSACGLIRNHRAHFGQQPPTHVRLTADDVHPFAPSGLTRPDKRGHALPICRACDQPRNSLRHRGPGVVGSTAPGSSAADTPRAVMPPTPEAERRANHGYPQSSPDRHPYQPGGDVLIRAGGGRMVKCADCDQPKNSPRHREPYGAVVGAPAAHRATPTADRPERHGYQPGPTTMVDRAGRRRVLCAECQLPANAQRHRAQRIPGQLSLVPALAPQGQPTGADTVPPGVGASAAPGATAPDDAGRAPQPPAPRVVASPDVARAPDRIKAPPAELALLAIAVDTVLALPVGSVDTGLWVRLASIRQSLDVPRLASLAPQVTDDDDGLEVRPSAPGTAPDARPIPRPMTGPAAATAIVRGIRSDKVRELVKRACRDGWDARKTGSGHIALTRNDRTVIVSATGSSRGGHWFANVRAEAKRAGIDVAGL